MFSITSSLGHLAAVRHGAERIEVADDHVDRLDALLLERPHVLGPVAAGQDAGVDRRVQRLHAAAQHLGRAGQLLDADERDAGLVQRRGRARGRDQLDPQLVQPAGERLQPGLVADRHKRSLDPHTGSFTRTRRPSTWMRPAANSRTASGSNRCSISCSRPRHLLGRLIIRNGQRLLQHDRAGVGGHVIVVDQVNGDAGDADAVRQSVGHRGRAGKGRQQRRVHVEDPPGVPARRNPATGCACSRRARRAGAVRVPGTRASRASSAETSAGSPAASARASPPASARLDTTQATSMSGASISAWRFVPDPEISTPAFSAAPPRRPRPARRRPTPSRRASVSTRTASSAASAGTTAMYPTPRLNTRRISSSSTPSEASQPNTAGRSQLERSIRMPTPAGSGRPSVAGDAAAGDVRHRADVDRCHQHPHRLGVDPRRLEQRVGDRAAAQLGRRVVQRGPGPLQQLADQREPVRVRAAGGQRDHHVAGADSGRRRSSPAARSRRRRSRPCRSRRPASCPGAPPSRRRAARSPPACSRPRRPRPARRPAPGRPCRR